MDEKQTARKGSTPGYSDEGEHAKDSKDAHLAGLRVGGPGADDDDGDDGAVLAAASAAEMLAADPERLLRDTYGDVGIASLLRDRYVLYCCLLATAGGLAFGFDQGLVSIILTMPEFLRMVPEIDPQVSTDAGFRKGLLTALLEAGAIFGALCAGYAADRLGRKRAILVGAAWFFVGSVVQSASRGYDAVVAGRFVGGVGVGMLSTIAPLYVSEVAPPHTRGILLSLEELSIVFGIVAMFFITFGTRYIDSQWSFRAPFVLQMLPALVLCAGLSFVPASPRWLAMRGRDDECLATLAKLRARPEDHALVQAEWLQMRAEAQLHREVQAERHPHLVGAPATEPGIPATKRPSSWRDEVRLEAHAWADCWRGKIWKRTLCGMLLMCFQQLVGINALIYYAPSIMEDLGFESDLRLVLSGVINVAQLVGVALSFLFVDRVGRRPLLLLGAAAMGSVCAVLAALVGAFHDSWREHAAAAYAGVALIMAYMVAFGCSWGPIPWAMPSELFSLSTRAKGTAFAVVSNWLNNFLVGLFVPPLQDASSGYGSFALFAITGALAFVWVALFVPETKGVPLERMDEAWGDDSSGSDRRRLERIQARLAQEEAARRRRRRAGSEGDSESQGARSGGTPTVEVQELAKGKQALATSTSDTK